MLGGRDLIRSGVRNLLREYWVGTTLGAIADTFNSAGFSPDRAFQSEATGARRALVDQYYAAIDWRSVAQVNRFVGEIVQAVLVNLESQGDAGGQWATEAKTRHEQLVRLLELDGFTVTGNRVQLSNQSALIEQARRAGDLQTLAAMLPRLEDTDSDPWLAIGTAKEIIEHIARVVIARSGAADPPKDTDLGDLTKAALKSLALLPADVPDAKRGADSIRRALQGLVQIVQGTAELRNLYGTGHGRKATARLYGRHARLVVGAALAWAGFIAETWEAQNQPPS